MLRAFAEAEDNAVPAVRLRSVNGDRSIEVESGETATGNIE